MSEYPIKKKEVRKVYIVLDDYLYHYLNRFKPERLSMKKFVIKIINEWLDRKLWEKKK
jgi:hypothetical protein